MIPPLRPKVELLSPDLIKKIIWEALEILDRQGVFIENAEALDLLREAGMRIKGDPPRVHITPQLVQDCLDAAPPSVFLYDRSGETSFQIGNDEVHFDPGSAAVTILDPVRSEQRTAVTRDVVDFVRLTDGLDNFHFQSTGLISGDVPDIVADSYRLYLGLSFGAKPVVTGTFRTEGFRPMFDMLAAVRGGADKLRRKPLAIFDACPSPPLKWSHLTAQSLVDCARAGVPSELISMGMTGATSPVTIAGTLVQHVAENFSGIVICQLAAKGAPVIFGGSPSSFDMRKGTTPMGAVETMMIDMAYAQIAKSMNLPTHAYMGLSDAKVIDSQAGLESGIGAVLAALAGINVVSGPGMMDFESCQSLEKMIVDNEICGMAYRLIAGISQRDEPIALALFERWTPGSQFLTQPHTREWYRLEHTFPSLIDRDTYDAWVSLGRKNAAERAADEVRRRLSETRPNILAESVRDRLKEIMDEDAKRNGVDSLPVLDPS